MSSSTPAAPADTQKNLAAYLLKANAMMIQSAPRTMPNFLGSEFNRFLFALVGTDRYGSQLSVISALARLDLDAWAEAASLARLPRDAAIMKLSQLLRRYPEIPQMTQESSAVAARLIALLPRGPSQKTVPDTQSSRWAITSGSAGIFLLIALAVLIGLQYVNLSSHSTPTPAPISQAIHNPPPAPQQQ